MDFNFFLGNDLPGRSCDLQRKMCIRDRSSVVNSILGGIYKSVIIRIIYAKIFNDKNLAVNMTVGINR